MTFIRFNTQFRPILTHLSKDIAFLGGVIFWGTTVYRVGQLFAATFFFFVCALSGSPRAATLIGDVIQAEYSYPTIADVYPSATGPITFTVGAGEEGSILVEGVTRLHFNFDSDSLVIKLTTSLHNPTWNSAAQNGPSFSVLSGNPFPAIESVTTTNGGPVSAFLSGGVLFVDWAGMAYCSGDIVTVTFDPVGDAPPVSTPLPAALPLFAGGLGALGLLGRRRKRQRN